MKPVCCTLNLRPFLLSPGLFVFYQFHQQLNHPHSITVLPPHERTLKLLQGQPQGHPKLPTGYYSLQKHNNSLKKKQAHHGSINHLHQTLDAMQHSMPTEHKGNWAYTAKLPGELPSYQIISNPTRKHFKRQYFWGHILQWHDGQIAYVSAQFTAQQV